MNGTTTINAAIDRCNDQLAASTATATSSAWQQVLAGLEVVIDYDRRIEELDKRMTNLEAACHECVDERHDR